MPSTLITGANRGIGLELSRQYLQAGWHVIACCRDPASASELQSLQSAPGKLQIEQLDVCDHASIKALAQRLGATPIDVLINNAGIIGPVPVSEHIGRQHFGSIDYSLWDQVLHTNLFGPMALTEALLTNIHAGEQRRIVAISSTVGSIVERQTPAFAYATSKAALNKAMSLLAHQLRDQGITVLILCPGYVRTRMDFGTADVEPTDSATGLRQLIDTSTIQDTGSFRRYNGDQIAW